MASGPIPSAAAATAPGKGGSGTRAMVVGATVSAVGALAFQFVGTRVLGEVEFAPIALLWTMQFLGFTVLYTPVEQLIIRRLTLSGGRGEALRGALIPAALVILAGAGLAAGFVAAVRERSFQGRWAFVVAAFVLFLSLGVYAAGRGVLAGRRRFRDYGLAVSGEAIGRLVLAGIVLAVATTAVSMSWALVLAPLVILAVRPFARGHVPTAEAAPDTASTGAFLTGMVITTTASQTILAAGPLVVDALGATEAAITTFFVTFTLFRGPLTASYNLLARVLPWFTTASARGEDPRLGRWTLLTGIGAVALTAVAAAGAAWLGPALVDVIFGVRPSEALAALAAGGVVFGALALFLGQVLVGRGTTGLLAAIWVGALVVAGVVLGVVDASPSIRTGWAFVAGEAAAMVGTVAAVMRPHRPQ